MSDEDKTSETITASTLSEDASPYILLQRIDTQRWNPSNLLPEHKRPFDGLYNNFLLELESEVRHQKICNQYLEQVKSDFNELKPYLPDNVTSILDIGCGMAGIDLFLWNYYSSDQPDVVLFDKTEVSEEVYYEFYDNSAFYNSLTVAEENLTNADIPEDRVHTVEASPENLLNLKSIDFVLSLYSWGFHYPVKTYLDQVLDVINRDGRVVLDIRKETGDVTKNTEGYKACRESFETIDVVKDERKFRRIMLSDPVKPAEKSSEDLEEPDDRRSTKGQPEIVEVGAV